MTETTIPEDWRLVPIEPTEAMLDAAKHGAVNPLWLAESYRKMLAAAPSPLDELQRLGQEDEATPSPELPEGMVAWSGGDRAPEDWDGGPVLFRDGSIGDAEDDSWSVGTRIGNWRPDDYDAIAYTPRRSPELQPTEEGDEQRARLTHHEQMLDAQSKCVPCKLCGGKAVITDAGTGAGYYINCANFQSFRRSKGCMLDQQRLGGWAYNVMDWWNRLHASTTTRSVREEVLEEAQTAVPDEVDLFRILKSARRSRIEQVKAINAALEPARRAIAGLAQQTSLEGLE